MTKDLTKLTDSELLNIAAEGKEEAFREIVNRYKNGLYAFLRTFLNQVDLIDDVFQETFLQLFHQPGQLRSNPAVTPMAIHYSRK